MKNTNLQKHEEYNKIFEELKEQFKEMGRLKSDFDIEKFTVKSKGVNLPAHDFHMLLRQYRFAVTEAKRMYIEKERLQRKLDRLMTNKPEDYDLDVMDLQRQIDDIEIDLVNKKGSIDGFEVCRQELIRQNGGKPYTDKQYQDEEPKFWEQKAKRQVLAQLRERNTGIKEGTTEFIEWLESPTLLPDSPNRVLLYDKTGGFNKIDWDKELALGNGHLDRVEFINQTLTALNESRKH
jgi:hypothetical protein